MNFDTLAVRPRTWLMTGVAGFIGSNLLEALLRLEQRVVGLDNFATGHRRNLDEVAGLTAPEQWGRFRFIEGDIRRLDDCPRACEEVGRASARQLGSLPRSGSVGLQPDKIRCHQPGRPDRSRFRLSGGLARSRARVERCRRETAWSSRMA